MTLSTGIITTIAGTGTNGYSGDGGAATSATIYWATGVAVDSSGRHPYNSFAFHLLLLLRLDVGNVYVVDEGNNRIRKVTVPTSSPR